MLVIRLKLFVQTYQKKSQNPTPKTTKNPIVVIILQKKLPTIRQGVLHYTYFEHLIKYSTKIIAF
jgi:hypothetical protein